MKCEKARELIAERSGGAYLPFLSLHLLRCPSCAAEARRMEAALAEMRRSFLPASPDFSDLIMGALRASPLPESKPVSFRDWMIAGAALLVAAGVSPLSDTFGWVKSTFGSRFLLPLTLVLGLGIAAYCALFIGTHLREITERFGLRHD